jgi:uncharacterized protein (TIGR00730 family)
MTDVPHTGGNKKVVNVPDKFLRRAPMKLDEIDQENRKRESLINQEISRGFDFIKKQPRSVTFFGSARFAEGTPDYERARRLGYALAKLGYGIITGGGPGIMEAGNRGAFEANGRSIGITIELPHEQNRNPYITDTVDFYYFFTRKVIMTFSAEAYLVFPGGYGTLNETFEILTLVQTNKIEKVPIIFVGEDFWRPIEGFLRESLFEQYAAIDREDLALFTVTDDEEKILKIIEAAPARNGVHLAHDAGVPNSVRESAAKNPDIQK